MILETSKVKEVRLRCWHELIGIFTGISKYKGYIYLKVDEKTLVFDSGSESAVIAERELSEVALGSEIGILRTDLATRPLLIRLVSLSKLQNRVKEMVANEV